MMKLEVVKHKKITLKGLYSVFIGLIPIISFYQMPFLEFGISTFLVGLTAPYALLYIFNGKKTPTVLFSFVIWILYMIFRSNGSIQDIFLHLMVLLHVWGCLKGALDFKKLINTIEFVSIAMTFLVLVQTISYYVLDLRLNFLIKAFMLPENQYYATVVNEGLYRPSALFLEPSHYAQYCCYGILSSLFPYQTKMKPNVKKALWIALGCILTTSGMGIVLCVCVFAWYLLFNKKSKGEKMVTTLLGFGLILVCFLILMKFSFFNQAVERIMGDRGAIWGRTLYWDSYIGTMAGISKFIGYGSSNTPDGYMTGIMSILYYYGYFGVAFLIILLISLMKFGKNNFTTCCCLLYGGMLLVANKTGFLSYIFTFGLIIASALYKREHKSIKHYERFEKQNS